MPIPQDLRVLAAAARKRGRGAGALGAEPGGGDPKRGLEISKIQTPGSALCSLAQPGILFKKLFTIRCIFGRLNKAVGLSKSPASGLLPFPSFSFAANSLRLKAQKQGYWYHSVHATSILLVCFGCAQTWRCKTPLRLNAASLQPESYL